MKRELPHFEIGTSYGGNQDWFRTFMMCIGGCGAETACDSSVYFALHRGLRSLYPFDLSPMTREQYVDFAHIMEPYLHPRWSGIDRLDIFVDGYAKYLQDRGEKRLSMSAFDGSESYENAARFVKTQIDGGYPIPTLILNHKNRAMKNYVWHWFLLNGYELNGDSLLVKAVTYSKYEWLDLRTLWDTGHTKKGGFIRFQIDACASNGAER